MDTKLLGLILQGDKRIAREITELKNTMGEAGLTESGAIVQTVAGESIVANDTSDDGLKGLRVFGKSEQFTTTGKNKLPNADVGQTINGVTFTVNEDKSVTINGTATNVADFYLFGGATDDGYYFNNTQGSLLSFGVTTDNVIPIFREKELGVLIGHSNISNGLMAQDCSFYGALLRVEGGQTVNNKTVYPMIREAGITDETYEPYTGGIPSPNPQYPQEIVSAGDDGDIEVWVYGKNLFKQTWGKVPSISTGLDVSTDSTTVSSDYIRVDANKTYTLSTDATFSDSYLFAYDENKSYLGYAANRGTLCQFPTLVKSHPSVQYLRIRFDGATSGRFQFEEGSVATEYEPYNKQTITIPTPNGLPGIPVTDASLATYTDANGQMWCADEIDFERGVYVKRIFRETFDGSDDEGWIDNSCNLGSRYIFYTDRTFIASDTTTGVISCNSNFPIANKGGTYNHPNLYAVTYNGIFISLNGNETLDEFKAYLAAKPMTVLCLYETPIETPLTESELTAYRALHSNYPVTTVLNDSGAHMELTYNADTKNYIDNKFTELTNAILSMGGNV